MAADLLLGSMLMFGIVTSVLSTADIWPSPASMSHGRSTLRLAKEFRLETAGGNTSDATGILKEAFQRFLTDIEAPHAMDPPFDGTVSSPPIVQGVNIVVHSRDEELQFGVDESYKLSVPASGSPLYVHVEAETVYGALHGLQTLSQLCEFNLNSRIIELHGAPWIIMDEPRFIYRGLLIDTSRHFQPLKMIKNVIDAMAYTKLNVLHWHIVDTQSFPIEVPSYPKLWKGAYSVSERYTIADAHEIVKYAQRRGIHVMAETDVPGHALSWGFGYPSLWPASDCRQPLDVSNEFTFQVLDGLLSDFSKVFKFKFIHLGGDEVDTGCWSSAPHVKKWLNEHHLNESEAYKYFILRAQKIAKSHGYEVVNWEETFTNFGAQLDPQTVVHHWLVQGVAQEAVAAGFRCIVSNQDKWYLDHLDATWQEFYMNEPLVGISDPKQQKLVLGGEVCMWGETADASDIQQTIWPRAAAAAERLWTPLHRLAKDPKQVTERLARFRCLLNQRGVAAAPLSGPGRGTPQEPGSCIKQ